ncbi:uncharacterized protein LOC144625085 [Crassostrea virginica]
MSDLRFAAVCTTADYAGHEKALTKKDTFDGGNFDRGHVMLDTLYTVQCCGEVQQWELYVEQAGRVQLQIWRGTASGYQLVGQNNFTLTSAGLKEQYLPIIPEQRIQVQTNDVIGWVTPDDEVIPYKKEGSGSLIIQENMADVSVGGVFDWSTGTLINRRYYAIKAILAPGNGPQMTTFPASVTFSHTTPIGTIVYTPALSSVSDTVTFSISPTGVFGIDSATGAITLSSVMAVGTYNLSVSVTDSCGRSDTQSLQVLSTNDAPKINGLPFSANLHENTLLETSLHTFTSSDDDGDAFTCTIENAANIFILKSNLSGSVIVFEIFSKSDPGSITISAKSTLIGTAVYVVQFTDPDSPVLSTSSNCFPLPCPFSVGLDGTITSTADLRAETTVSYSIQFYVNDSQISTGPAALTVLLSDLNTAPVFQNLPHTLTVSEHLSLTSLIYQISIYDPDVSDSLSTTFTVQPSSGSLLFNTNSTGT